MRRHIAVIGAGWAGCAAAVTLAQEGHRVTLFEAAQEIGGRARAVALHEQSLDNGQHILLGAYDATLKIMRTVGLSPPSVLLRLPLQMRYADSAGLTFVTARLPAPLHLLAATWRATGLSRQDKIALLRLSSAARWMGWQLDTDCAVSTFLERFDQTERLTRLMWRPLCIAALNTPPERASAQVFLNVLKDSFGARRAASDMLLPRCDLSALFPRHAAQFVVEHGSMVVTGCRVRAITAHRDQGWTINADAPAVIGVTFDQVVIATDPSNAAKLLSPIDDVAALNAMTYESITTCYFQYAPTVRLSQPFFALMDQPESGTWGQFVFDRGHLNSEQRGLLAVVVSASHDAGALGHPSLTAALIEQLATVFSQPALRTPLWSKVITEKRATFSCTPGLRRPTHQTSHPSLVLAGDYTAGRYPATLESAVRSGIEAARLLINVS